MEWKSIRQRLLPPVSSGEEYLHRLGSGLLLAFPAGQALDILADYREYLSQEEGDFAQSLRRWGPPGQALRTLLAENPGARGRLCRRVAFWGGFLLLSALCALYIRSGLFTLLLFSIALPGLAGARERLQLERHFPAPAKGERAAPFLHGLIFAAVFLVQAQLQALAQNAHRLPLCIGNIPVGQAVDTECALLGLAALCLLLFWLLCACTHSVQNLAGVFHALGALVFLAQVRCLLRGLDSPERLARLFLAPLLCYGLGALFALAFTRLAAPGRKG